MVEIWIAGTGYTIYNHIPKKIKGMDKLGIYERAKKIMLKLAKVWQTAQNFKIKDICDPTGERTKAKTIEFPSSPNNLMGKPAPLYRCYYSYYCSVTTHVPTKLIVREGCYLCRISDVRSKKRPELIKKESDIAPLKAYILTYNGMGMIGCQFPKGFQQKLTIQTWNFTSMAVQFAGISHFVCQQQVKGMK